MTEYTEFSLSVCLCSLVVAAPLEHIYKSTLASGKIPSIWKMVQVIPLHKGGDTCDLNTYQLKLSCLSKILQSYNLSSQVRVFLEENKVRQP